VIICYAELCKVPEGRVKFWIGLDPVQKDNPDGTNIRVEFDAPYRRIVLRMNQAQAVAFYQALADALTARERKINIPRPPWKKRPTHFEHDPNPNDDGSV
jgi:hypothetical protein